jgi:hypothetical protein
MTDFAITLPDGREVVVDAKDEAGAVSAAKNFMMREAATTRGKEGGVKNFVRSMANTLTFGGADEAKAAVQSAMPGVIDFMNKPLFGGENPNPTPRGPDAYEAILGEDRAQSQGYAAAHPWADVGGKVAGAVTGLPMLPKAVTGTSPGLVRGTARSAATAGGLSVPYGFGEGEGGFEDRAWSAGKHGLMGLAGGALLHPLGMGLRAGVSAALESGPGRYVADKVIRPGFNMVADAFDRVAPKVKPQNLSAAAPDGGVGIPTDSVLGRVAEGLRGTAPSGENILDNAAAKRIADALQRGGDDVPGMRARLGELGQDAMPLDVNPMTQRLASTAYISPGKAPKLINQRLDARDEMTGARVGESVRQAFGDTNPAVLEAQRLRGLRSGEGASNFDEAIGPDAAYVISPQMRQIMQEAPAVQRAMDTIMANATDRGVRLTPAQVAHRVKRQLALEADSAFSSGRPVNKTDVGNLSERWRTALHEANPAIREADTAWQAGTARMEALDLGRQFMRQGTSEVDDAVSPAILAQRIPQMSADEANAFLAGAADTLYVKANSGPDVARQVMKSVQKNSNLRAKLDAMIGPENTRILYNRAMSEKAFAGSDRVVRGGSDTSRKLLSAMDDAASGDIPTTPGSMVSRLLSGVASVANKQRAGNEAVRERIAKMLTETDVVANDDLINRIAAQLSMAKRPRGIQRGAVTGASGQE